MIFDLFEIDIAAGCFTVYNYCLFTLPDETGSTRRLLARYPA